MMRMELQTIYLTLIGLLFLPLLPLSRANGAALGEPEITIDAGYPDTIRIVAANYAFKSANDYDLISCIGPIEERPDDGLIFLCTDTAFYYGLPSAETHGRAIAMARPANYVLVIRNLTEGFNASRMFDLTKFDAIILNAAEVGAGVTPADMMNELGDEAANFEMHYGLVPNKVLLLTNPMGEAKLKSVDAGEGLYKMVITFEDASMSAALYWLDDATFALKAYNPKTNGKILALNDGDDWDKLMANDGFAKDINADKISAIVMPDPAEAKMVKNLAKAGVQRVVLYGYDEETIDKTPVVGDPISLVRMIDGVSVYNCIYPIIELFWYQT